MESVTIWTGQGKSTKIVYRDATLPQLRQLLARKFGEKLYKRNACLGSAVGQQRLLQIRLCQYDWTQPNCDALDVNGQDVGLRE